MGNSKKFERHPKSDGQPLKCLSKDGTSSREAK